MAKPPLSIYDINREEIVFMETANAIDLFLRSRQAKGLSLETIRWYRGILLFFAQRFPDLPDSSGDIEEFLLNCQAGDERRHGYYRCLRCFYRFLNKRLGIPNPIEMVDSPRRAKKYPPILMPEDIDRLLRYPHPPKIKAALLFLADTGARPSELAELEISNLTQTPWGFAATIKGKTGMRTVPLNYETYHAMMVNLPLSYTKYRLRRKIAEAFNKSGVKGSALTLRHTYATFWEGDELMLQQIMGHAHLSTTRLYRHLRIKTLTEQHHKYSLLNMVLSTSKSML